MISSQNERRQSVKHKQDYRYHPKVRNLVMDKVVTNFEGGISYTAKSTLRSHTMSK
jgi:hypothetical protein